MLAIEPPAGEMVDGLRNLDDGYIPPIFIENGGERAPRREADRPPPGVDRVDPPAHRGRIFAGLSSGAALAGAAKTAAAIESGTIVVVSADGGWKYLSTGAWTDDLDVVGERASRSPTSDRPPAVDNHRGHRRKPDHRGRALRSSCTAVRRELARPRWCRVSGYLVRVGRDRRADLDAGPGTFAHLQQCVDPATVDAVIISHHHPDHWTDLYALATHAQYALGRRDVPVYAPARLAEQAGLADCAGPPVASGDPR